MRIISGKYKGRKLKGFNIEGTRPTMDRVKESLFAILAPKLNNSVCLDLFAGSGALGLEALSNGAKTVTFVDNSKEAVQIIKDNAQNVQEDVEIILSDYKKYIKNCSKKFDIIFLDPPYDRFLISKTIKYILENNLLAEKGLIVCEYEHENIECWLPLIKEKSYGGKNIKIFQK